MSTTTTPASTTRPGPPEGFLERGPCPLCGGVEFVPHVEFRDLPVRRCKACGFIHPAFAMGPEAIARYYRDVFHSPWHRRGQELNSYINIRALRRMPMLAGVRSFLDVGTGYGFLLKRLGERGIEATGVEPSLAEAHWGRDQLGVKVIDRVLEQSGLPESSFDAVGCFEVIEHTPDPKGFVALLSRFVKPGGLLIVNTDNFEAKAVRRLGPEFPKWIPHSHICDFAPATLERCVTSVPGLTIAARQSYTAWELLLRGAMKSLRAPKPAAECFSLSGELEREMKRKYRHWGLRLTLAHAGFTLTRRDDLEGSMMFVVARKAG